MAGYGKRKEGIGPFTPHDMTPTDAGNTLKLQEAEWAEIKVEHRLGSDRGERGARDSDAGPGASAVEETKMEKWKCSPHCCFPDDRQTRLCCGC